jgi:hypothetical protein
MRYLVRADNREANGEGASSEELLRRFKTTQGAALVALLNNPMTWSKERSFDILKLVIGDVYLIKSLRRELEKVSGQYYRSIHALAFALT